MKLLDIFFWTGGKNSSGIEFVCVDFVGSDPRMWLSDDVWFDVERVDTCAASLAVASVSISGSIGDSGRSNVGNGLADAGVLGSVQYHSSDWSLTEDLFVTNDEFSIRDKPRLVWTSITVVYPSHELFDVGRVFNEVVFLLEGDFNGWIELVMFCSSNSYQNNRGRRCVGQR